MHQLCWAFSKICSLSLYIPVGRPPGGQFSWRAPISSIFSKTSSHFLLSHFLERDGCVQWTLHPWNRGNIFGKAASLELPEATMYPTYTTPKDDWLHFFSLFPRILENHLIHALSP
jgi:hypothetical protein